MPQLKKRIKRLISRLQLLNQKRVWKQKLKHIYSVNPALSKSRRDPHFTTQVREYFRQYNLKVNPIWHHTYWQINGFQDVRYLPDDTFHLYIEPRLNRRDLWTGYIDKNIYDRLLPGVPMPKTVLRNMNGQFLGPRYQELTQEQALVLLTETPGTYIVKPAIDSAGGKNVKRLAVGVDGKLFLNDQHMELKDLERIYGKDFIVQETLRQHEFLDRIYPGSVNTIRVITLRFDGAVHVLSAIIRMGSNGAYVDNFSAGGICCGICPDGVLNDFAVDKTYSKYRQHPSTNFTFQGTAVPVYSEIKSFAQELHNFLPPYFNLVSWDLALDHSGQLNLIEFNLRSQQIDFHQVHNGPLLRDLTEPLLKELFPQK